ncbi:MAG: ADP-ribosyltransferase [Alphaproteobacteria bacterium]
MTTQTPIPKLSLPQKEALNFYARSHYLIINNLMCQKFDELLLKWLPIVNDNDKGMIKEALEQGKAKRFCTDEKWGEKIFNAYVKRTTDTLTTNDIEKHLRQAVRDILLINNAMKPLETDLTVFRKVHLKDHFRSCSIGDKKDIPCFISTTLNPDKYETSADVVLYKITLPKGMPVIRIDLLDKTLGNEYFGTYPQNEEEVLLPPMRFQVLDHISQSVDNIKGKVNLKAVQPLDALTILKNALNQLYKTKKLDLRYILKLQNNLKYASLQRTDF